MLPAVKLKFGNAIDTKKLEINELYFADWVTDRYEKWREESVTHIFVFTGGWDYPQPELWYRLCQAVKATFEVLKLTKGISNLQ